jgi:hypothetical protein
VGVMRQVAYFISPHGFGHAARASGVMAAVQEMDPSIRFDIFTTVPRWFFQESLIEPFVYHSLKTDIGLVQITALREDISRTLQSLDEFLPFDGSQIKNLAKQVHKKKCRLILCDIAPMGIVVAHEAGIPSVLIENFTWDWIYQGYAKHEPRLHHHIDYLKDIFQAANYHIQTEPICNHTETDLNVAPVSRKCRTPRKEIRNRLSIPDGCRAVMITMGGTPQHYTSLELLAKVPDVYFIIRVGSEPKRLRDNLLLLPFRSNFFHPDLIHACDAVIGKVGYSTMAEVYSAGVPFGYVTRPVFRESAILEAYIRNHMEGMALTESEFEDGVWIEKLEDLLALPRTDRGGSNGVEQIAAFICRLLQAG